MSNSSIDLKNTEDQTQHYKQKKEKATAKQLILRKYQCNVKEYVLDRTNEKEG